MKKSNKNILLFLFFLVTITIGIMSNSKSRNYVTNKVFSNKTTQTSFESIKDVSETKKTNENNIIYINIDGFSYSTYEKANENPLTQTENINRLIQRGVLFTNAKTGIPSITDSMQQSIASGAWPIDTGNCYRYYDLEKDEIIQYSRENELENIAQAANRNNIDLLAINGWFFEEEGSDIDKGNLYIEDATDTGYKGRFKILKDVLKGEEIESYGKRIRYDRPPEFISIYLDEVDEAAHNLSDKMMKDSEIELETRIDVNNKIVENLYNIDLEIGEVIDILEEKGLFDKTTFIITTDHGAVPFGADTKEEAKTKDYAYSQMPDLLESISSVGKKHIGKDFKVEMVNNEGDKADKLSDAIVTSIGLQAQIKFREQPSEEFLEDIVESVKGKSYYGDHMYSDELRVRGVPPRFADLLISPKAPYHFSDDFERGYYAVNQHDSLDERVQNIFTMISGPTVTSGEYYDDEVYNIDIAPTIGRILGFEGPKSATGTALDDVLKGQYRGPKLDVIGLKEDIKKVSSDTETLVIETLADSEIKINRKKSGNADEDGNFKIEEELELGINRFIIEASKDGKTTRRVVFVEKVEVDKEH